MKGISAVAVLILLLAGALVLLSAAFTVNETQQAIITRFGKPVRLPIATPGLHWKMPFVEKVQYFEKRFLEWDGDQNQVPTRDKRFIFVDSYARWRISDPLQFFKRLRDERSAQSRLDDILDGETRNTVARHDLIEVVRTSNREFAVVEELGDDQAADKVRDISFGRAELAREVLESAAARVSDMGIEVLDFRFKRLNYVPEVRKEVYARMISERKRIAERFRSEGAGEAARITGERDRELQRISSEAYRQAQEIKGKADAEAADIYAKAYNRDPDFYRFMKSMEVVKQALRGETTLLLGTDGELLRYLERSK